MKKLTQRGFGLVEVLLIVLVVLVLGFGVYYVLNQNSDEETSAVEDQATQQEDQNEEQAQQNTPNVPDGWVETVNADYGFSYWKPTDLPKYVGENVFAREVEEYGVQRENLGGGCKTLNEAKNAVLSGEYDFSDATVEGDNKKCINLAQMQSLQATNTTLYKSLNGDAGWVSQNYEFFSGDDVVQFSLSANPREDAGVVLNDSQWDALRETWDEIAITITLN